MKFEKYYIFPSRDFEFDKFQKAAMKDESPSHALMHVSKRLNARLETYSGVHSSFGDQAKSKIWGLSGPQHWAAARQRVAHLGDSSMVLASGEDIGFPLAFFLKKLSKRAKLAIILQNPESRRTSIIFKILGLKGVVDRVIVSSPAKAAVVRKVYGFSDEAILVAPEQTDTQFFRPLDIPKSLNCIASCGLEQRDYVSLASAIENSHYALEVCAVSPNAKVDDRTFPSTLPNNMKVAPYGWTELRDLYNRSSATVISLYPNTFEAGFTAMMEAMACGSPVIMTEGEGLIAEIGNKGLIKLVPSRSPEMLRAAIDDVVSNEEATRDTTKAARDYILKYHSSEGFVASLCDFLES